MRVILEKILVEPQLRPEGGIKVALEETSIVVEILGASIPGSKGDKGDKGDPGPAGFGTQNEVIHTLTDEDLELKRFSFLPMPLDPNTVEVQVLGGTFCLKGWDFDIIDGNVFTWNGRAFDGYLERGERIKLLYFST